MKRYSINTLKAIQWLCGQAIKDSRPTYSKFVVWYSKNLRGGQKALRETWQDLYDARIVDTLDPNDSYEFQGRE